MNRIDRLLAILLRISDGKLFRAEKLAQEFELSERTIYRDMRALMQMGIPIRAEAGVGYQLQAGYFLPPLLFERDEAVAVGFALKFLTTYSPDSFKKAALNALRKIESVLSRKVRADFMRELEVLDYVPEFSPIPFSDTRYRQLTTAIKDRRVVELEYFGYRRETPDRRRIEPVKLFLAPGRNIWYLDAFCLTRNDWRSFRLDRIVQVLPAEARFSPRPREENQPPEQANEQALVYARPEKARWIREHQHWSLVSEHDTPEGLVVWAYQNFDWPSFVNWLCTVGDLAIRIEPEEVRARLQDKISDLRKLLT